MLDAQSVSISNGTAIAVIPNRVNALRRDILSVILALPILWTCRNSLIAGHTRRVWKALIEKCAAHDNVGMFQADFRFW